MSAGSSAFSDGWRLVPGVASVCACGVRSPSAPRRRWRPLRAPSLRLALLLGPPPPAAVVVWLRLRGLHLLACSNKKNLKP